ncbi:hypothetical protein SAMN04515656_104108 [Eubacterium aggregans]|uniref:Uncharacterized protein n=2 Tax=Eubacterium aggregans TaxID=81409 RepID=A0A1H3YV00_9FIRM|nr:hypothetical protein SAMN04515656_104108 [Eubacterium aggregans]
MAFGNKKEEKLLAKQAEQEKQIQEMLNDREVSDLPEEYRNASIKAMRGLAGNNLAAISAALKGNTSDMASLTYLNSITEQNWIIIRLLNEISSKLDK